MIRYKIMKTKFLVLLGVFAAQWCIAQSHKPGHFADIRGIKMYYEIYGKGEPLLFIHGNGGSTHDFHEQVSFFSKKYKVILADSRAQGKSVDEGDSLSYEMMADDLNALLDHIKIDSCNVVGWSDGGINGLLLAMRHPEKVKKLAITGTNLWPDSTALDPWFYKKMIQWRDELPVPTSPKLKNERKLLELMIDQPHIKTGDLRQVKCPSLIIGGDHDVIQPAHTLLIASSIPRSYLWILPNSGHSTLMTNKDEFNRVVMDFLTRPYRRIEELDRLK